MNAVKRAMRAAIYLPLLAAAAHAFGAPIEGNTATQVTDPQVKAVAAGDTAFGLSLIGKLTADEPAKNVFVSPFSVSQALGLAYNGAAGETQQQIGRALGIDGISQGDSNQANKNLLDSLQNQDPKFTISVANALWANQGITLNATYKERMRQYYNATADTLNLRDPSGAAAINDWVGKNTQGKITQIVTPEAVKYSAAVLTNAIYFHADWSQPFKKLSTHDGAFTLGDGTTKTLPMMSQTSGFSYLENDQFQAVRLPYGQGQIAMYVFLPKANDGLDAFVESATPANWDAWITKMQRTSLQLTLPKFKAEQSVTLNKPLIALGITDAFTDHADFNPMGLHGSFISQVIHKAVLDVDEEGTTAAAATAVIMHRAAMMAPKNKMVVDHPFFCAIRDDQSGALLFAGAIRNPE